MYIIGFGFLRSGPSAALYEAPFEYLRKHVLPLRKRITMKVMQTNGGCMANPGQNYVTPYEHLSDISRLRLCPNIASSFG